MVGIIPAQRIILADNRIQRINIKQPRMGSKAWLLDGKGIFVLEEGPGVLGTVACTHAGSGNMQCIDGVPGDQGFFPDDGLDENDPDFHNRNGRPLFHASPIVMGSWWMNAGFEHGLTIISLGGSPAVSAIATITWAKMRAQ